MKSAPATLLVGRTLSHFRILSLLGEGGMGEVYEAEDTNLRRRVALKVLSSSAADSGELRERLLREARAAAAVSHPNIAIVHEVDECEGIAFIAMERLDGKTLRAILAAGPLPFDESVRIAREIAGGLAHAHRMNVVHRDLKPENVIVADDGRVKILDFGLAKVLPTFDTSGTTVGGTANPSDTTLTRAGSFVGTLAYASPEQVRGEPVDAKSDVFSFGALLYEMVSGASPFRRATPIETATAVLRDDPPPPSRARRETPATLDRLIARCLTKDAGARLPSAEAIVTELDSLGVAGRPSRRGRRPSRGVVLAAVAVLLAIAAVVSFRRPALRSVEEAGDTASSPSANAVTPRRSIAVLGFKDLSATRGAAWLSTALSEMLTTELAAAEAMRTISGENVSQMKLDLGLGEESSFGAETLAKIHGQLGADLVVLGSYVALGGDDAERQIRLDLRLQDARDGETLASVVQTGTEKNLFDLVAIAGGKLRSALGVSAAAAAEVGATASAFPLNAQAARLYAEGLQKLRRFEARSAQELLEKSAELDPDRAATHSALATAWEQLGYEDRQRESAARAFELSTNLPREPRLAIESNYRQAMREWDRALEVQNELWTSFPDNLDYGLRLAAMQTRAGRGKDALATFAELRQRSPAADQDPRVDLGEANAANSVSDSKRAAAASARAVSRAAASGARLLAAQARLAYGLTLNRLGEPDSAKILYEEARNTFADAGDRSGAARSLSALANLLRDRGEMDAAIEQFQRALQVFREIGYKSREASTLNDMASVYYYDGDLAHAKELYQKALAIDIETGNRAALPHRLGNIANVLDGQGDLKGALTMHERALAGFEEIDHLAGAARTRNNIGIILLQQARVADARAMFEKAAAAQREAGLRADLAASLLGLSNTLRAGDDLPGARRAAEEAVRIQDEIEEKDSAAVSRIDLGRITFEEGQFAEAKRQAILSAKECLETKDDPGRITALALQADAERALGEIAAARGTVATAESLASREENRALQLDVAISAARIRADSGEIDAAEKALHSVIADADERGIRVLSLQARLAEGVAALKGASSNAARARLATLKTEAQSLGFKSIARQCDEALR